MEIGSFIEMDFHKGLEYYKGENVLRLNSGRAAIYHCLRVLNCSIVHLPYYQCESVREFLIKKNINVEYYHIDSFFNPIIETIAADEAIVIVNYFGIMGNQRMQELSNKFNNVIVDNAQAFFSKPLDNAMNVYSPRKFVGVPDGAYVIGANANNFASEYELDFSSDTSQFLLQRIEYGCEGKVYENRMINEDRIDKSDIKIMSKLTHAILDGIDYELIERKRKENFEIASKLFNSINLIIPQKYFDNTCIPMVYPLIIEDEKILLRLLENKIFQGHWWTYILNELQSNSFEYWLSKNIIPITIDQRYGITELEYMNKLMG